MTDFTLKGIIKFFSPPCISLYLLLVLFIFLAKIYSLDLRYDWLFKYIGFYVALRPWRRDDLLGTGTEWDFPLSTLVLVSL